MLFLASAWAGLQLSLQGPTRIEPGERLSLQLELAADEDTSAAALLDLPDGWRLLLPEPPVELAAGTSRQRRLLVQVPDQADAGTTDLAWCARAPTGESLGCATHTVEVGLQRAATLEMLQPPGTFLPGDHTVVELQLQNRGNGSLQPQVDVRCPEALQCSIDPAPTLRPGELRTLLLTLEARGNGGGEGSIGLFVRADGATLAKKELPIEVLGAHRGHKGPFLAGRFNARVRASDQRWDGTVGLQLDGTGTVTHTHTVALRVDADGLDPNSQLSTRWSSRHWSLEGGWRQASLAPMKQAERGLDLQGRLGEAWGLAGGLQRSEDGLAGRVTAFGTLWKARLEAGVIYDGEVHPLVQLTHPWVEAGALFGPTGLERARLSGGIPHHLRVDANWQHGKTTTWRGRALWTHDWHSVHTELGWQSLLQDRTHHQVLALLRTTGETTLQLKAELGPTRQLGTARLSGNTANLRGSASIGVNHDEKGPSVTGQGNLGVVAGRWRPRAELMARWAPEVTTAALTGSLEHHQGRTVLGSRASVELGVPEVSLGASLRHQTRGSQTLQANVDGRWRDGAFGVAGSVAISVPFRIPLPDPGTSTVRGRLHHQGEGLGGVLVRLGDQVAVTRGDGTFAFRDVAPGEHVLDVVDRMPAGQVPLEPHPRTVTLSEDGGTAIDIELGAAARVVAQATWRGPTQSLEGVLVELTRGEERLRRLLDADGRVELGQVRPGLWNVRVDDRGLLPEGATWEAPATLEVPEGAVAQLELQAAPKQRTIQMLGF